MKKELLAVCVCAAVAACPAMADWDVGDAHKMHFPQLPDPFGWDVSFYLDRPVGPILLADDWVCTDTGPVDDIHFWVSYNQEENSDVWCDVTVDIYSNDPDGWNGYSTPNRSLWRKTFYTIKPVIFGQGDQGWLNPCDGLCIEHDHQRFFQFNLVDIDDPFIQEEGEVYWLAIRVSQYCADQTIGWKTADVDRYPQDYAGRHFMDDAVYMCPLSGQWYELRDPRTQESLDLAFVITPEPATMAVLGLGALALIARRRRK